MRDEINARDRFINNLQTELERVRGELEFRDNQLSGVTLELEKLREDQHFLKGEVLDRESAITTLQTELEKVQDEVRPKPPEQMELFPTEPTLEQLQPVPKVRVKGKGKTQKLPAGDKVETESEPPVGTLSRGELVKHILEKFPGSKINGQNITDAINGKSKNLPKFESEYGFKFLGKIKG